MHRKTNKRLKGALTRYKQYFGQSVHKLLTFHPDDLVYDDQVPGLKNCSPTKGGRAAIETFAKTRWPISSNWHEVTCDYNIWKQSTECNFNPTREWHWIWDWKQFGQLNIGHATLSTAHQRLRGEEIRWAEQHDHHTLHSGWQIAPIPMWSIKYLVHQRWALLYNSLVRISRS